MKWCPWLIDFHIFVSFPTTTPIHPGSTVFLAYILARFYFQVLIVYIVFVLLFFRLLLLFGGWGGGGAVVCFLSLARIELCALKTVSLAGFGALGFDSCIPVTLEYSKVIVKWWCCREHDELQSGEASSSAQGQEGVESSN